MNRHFSFRFAVLLGVILALAGLAMAQRVSNKVLVLNGQPTSVPVAQIGGRSYVDIEALAQITDGSISFESNRILLTIPSLSSAAEGPGSSQRLSKDLSNAGLGALASMREWKAAIETMIRFQLPAEGPWFQDYRDRAEESMRLAKVAASNAADQRALQLLENEFANLSQWAGSAVEQRRNLNATRTMSPDVLQNDQTLQRISSCSQFLGSMLVGGTFSDNPACH